MHKFGCDLFSALAAILAVSVSIWAQPELDISFNGNGRATAAIAATAAQGTNQEFATLVQSDNKIVAVGTVGFNSNGTRYFGLTRFNTDGTKDISFGDHGDVITDFDPNASVERAFAAAIQPDGKIIVAGTIEVISPGLNYFTVARYNPNGSLDNTFGALGKTTINIVQHINQARAVAIAPDGKIVAAGYYFGPNQNFQTMIVRLLPDGTRDSSFGSNGVVTDNRGFTLGDSNIPLSVAVQPDGKVVTGGYYSENFNPSGRDITFLRFNANGTPDTSFAGTGRILIASPTLSESISGVAIQPDGKIVGVGFSGNDALVIRLNPNGTFDTTFDGDGRVPTSFGGSSSVQAVSIRPNGNILVAGSAGNFALASFNPDGSPDLSFSGDGQVTFGFTLSPSVSASSMTIDSLGRVILGGTVGVSFGVARLYTLEPVPVTVSGQARTPDGTPIRGVRVGLADASGFTRWAITSNFGFFSFDDVPTGQTYNLFVRGSKSHIFESTDIGLNQVVNVDLIGTPRESMKGLKGQMELQKTPEK